MFHNKKFKLINVLSNSINIKLLQYKWTTTRTLHYIHFFVYINLTMQI